VISGVTIILVQLKNMLSKLLTINLTVRCFCNLKYSFWLFSET